MNEVGDMYACMDLLFYDFLVYVRTVFNSDFLDFF